jgi:hypothetical protein
MLSANMRINSASASAFGLESPETLYSYLPDRLTARRYRDFLETVLPGLPEDVPLAVR